MGETPGPPHAVLSLSDFAARLADPAALSGEGCADGGVAAVVDLRSSLPSPPGESAARAFGTVPGVVVGVAGPDRQPSAGPWQRLTDVVVAPEQLDRLIASLALRPKAAAALALLLRNPHPSGEAGLVAESATYSTLQAGAEFGAWLAERPDRKPPSDETSAPVMMNREGDRLTVTVCRPGRHNALNAAMRAALAEALTVALADPTVTVVLKGAGPSFCSGGDLDEFGTAPDPATAHLIRLTGSPAALAARLGPRLEAHVHGACIGAGIELAAFAGRVVAHPDTFFALPELSLGLIPGSGGTVSLPRRIGRHRTAWLALSGERIDAAQALAWGLVDAIR